MKLPRTLVILAVLQAAGAALAVPALAQDERDDRSEARATSRLDTTVTIAKDGTVDLHLVSGEIIVNAGTGNQVRVHATSERGILQFSASPSRVSLEVRSQHGRMGDTRYEVTVPVGIRLELKSVSGDITARGVKGELEVGAVSGDIEVADGVGRVELESVSGDIKAERLSGESRVSAVSGDVTISNVTGTLEVETVSGEMTLEDASLSSLRTETVSGELTYDGTLDPSGRYEFHSQSGDIRLRIPATAGGTVRMETFSGSIDSDFPMTMEPGGRGMGEHPKRLEFTFGSGGSRITAETFSGDINIEKTGGGTP
jgi:DUF4097 and DUF4098 domain-containing protein YvlB